VTDASDKDRHGRHSQLAVTLEIQNATWSHQKWVAGTVGTENNLTILLSPTRGCTAKRFVNKPDAASAPYFFSERMNLTMSFTCSGVIVL
jgi:hypothetical protein